MTSEQTERFFSIIIPVYNRPDEVQELLNSLTWQTYTHFEVLIIEDGSSNRCKSVANSFEDTLTLRYFYKENSGQGFSRNYGFERAKGDYFIIFDSDCVIPENYLQVVNTHLNTHWLDAYGGPDRAHSSFTPLQKAISYSMTSPLTTGGIRGNKEDNQSFKPRSFNMGISRKVYEQTGGFDITRMGEDISLSIEIEKADFKTGLISEAFVYHKRRTSLIDFFKQLHFFGRARININRLHPGTIKLVHSLPALFVLLIIFYLTLPFWFPPLFWLFTAFGLLFCSFLGLDALRRSENLQVASLSIPTSLVQLIGYGTGFIREGLKEMFGRSNN